MYMQSSLLVVWPSVVDDLHMKEQREQKHKQKKQTKKHNQDKSQGEEFSQNYM